MGVEIAREFVNADGGVGGRPIILRTESLVTPEDAAARVTALQQTGAAAVIGAYSSSLSMPASQAAAQRGILYWEAGAVADQVTGRGYPLVFRVGATGNNLGTMSARFAALVLAGRLGVRPSQLRMAIVHNTDLYPVDVARAAAREAQQDGIPVVASISFDPRTPDWPGVIRSLEAARPDILVLSSYIPDGVAFREAMLRAGLHVKAMIGSTMAQCVPEFGALLGADAIGVFASDRPPHGFNPQALTSVGGALYARFSAAYRARAGSDPTEESLAGFAAAWTLFHYVMPQAARAGGLSPAGMAAAARRLDLPSGTLVNGAGVRFATTADLMGQNLRAASVIWQWQAIRDSVTVYPPVFATGQPSFIPLPR